jgi:hypothetical protein
MILFKFFMFPKMIALTLAGRAIKESPSLK